MLQDYETLVEILQEAQAPGKHYTFTIKQLNVLGVPEAARPLDLRNNRKRVKQERKEQETVDEFYLSPMRENSGRKIGQNYMASARTDRAGMSEMEAILVGAITSDSGEEPKPLRF